MRAVRSAGLQACHHGARAALQGGTTRLCAVAAIPLVMLLSGCAARASAPADTPGSRRAGSSDPAAVRRLRADLAAVFSAPVMARGVWGVDVRSLASGETLYQLNAQKLMMPASNMKIVTMAVAAEILGWDFRFTTSLEATAPIADGVLQGDLFVRSNGDPTINRREGRAEAVLTEWALALHTAGIREIHGRVIGDDQAFDDEGIGRGWSWDYLEAGYAAPSGALQFNENVAAVTVTPGAAGDPATVQISPGTGFLVISRAVTGAAGSEETIEYRRRIDSPVLEISGSLPAGGKPVRRNVAVLNPTLFFAQSLKDALIARGIAVTGDAADIDDVSAQLLASGAGGERRTLVTTQSPPLREIGTVLMKVSQNLYAETLLKAMGAARGGLGTTQGGLRIARQTLTSWGIPSDAYVMADGSGLSRYNYLAPSSITAILDRMHRGDHRHPFHMTLPIAGRDGTISSRMRRTRAEGNAIAKTGSIANVRSLSGFVNTRDGETLVFSIVANDFVIPAATVQWITDLAVEILANFTRDR